MNEPVAVSRKQEQAKWLNDGGGKTCSIFPDIAFEYTIMEISTPGNPPGSFPL